MKKFLLIFCAALLAGQFSVSQISIPGGGACGLTSSDEVTWNYIRSDSTLNISGQGRLMEFSNVNDKEPWWFFAKDIKRIVISDNVNRISRYTFKNLPNLESVVFGRFTTEIHEFAFYNCKNLDTFTLPDEIERIDLSALTDTKWYADQPDGDVYKDGIYFGYKGTMTPPYDLIIKEGTYNMAIGANNSNKSNIGSIVIPKSMRYICDLAFADCNNVDEIVIPEGVISIGQYAFTGCPYLTQIVIPSTVVEIKTGAFYNTQRLKTFYCLAPSVPILGKDVFLDKDFENQCYMFVPKEFAPNYRASSKWTGINVADMIITDHGFCGSTLEGANGKNLVWTYNDYCKAIIITGTGAMGNYKDGETPWKEHTASIERLILGNEVRTIGDNAFAGTGIYSMEEDGNLNYVGVDAFSNTPFYNNHPDGNVLVCAVYYKYKGIIPENEAAIVEDYVRGISPYAFAGQSNPYTVLISSGIECIERSTFRNSKLMFIDLPESITEICDSAFANCPIMEEISLPENVDTLGSGIIAGSPYLNFIYPMSIVPPKCNENTFPNNTLFFIPDANYDIYTVYDPWSKFNLYKYSELYVEGYCGAGGTTDEAASWYFDNLSSKLIISGKGSIMKGAKIECPWYKYRNLFSELEICDGITSLSDSIFYDCGRLEKITFPATLHTIGTATFDNCQLLANITLPDGLTELGQAFNNTAWLNNQPDGNVILDSYYYKYKGEPEDGVEIAVDKGIKVIADNALSGIGVKFSVVIPESVEILPEYLFASSFITSVKLSEGLLTISRNAFSDCQELTELTIPPTVTYISGSAVTNCGKLKNVTLLAKEPCVLDDVAFSGLADGVVFYVDKMSLAAYKAAEYWKDLNIQAIEETEPVGNDIAVDDDVDFYTMGHNIVIEGMREYKLYSSGGAVVASGCGSATICDLPHGVYVLRIGGASNKIAL